VEDLAHYQWGRLTEEARFNVEEHVLVCAECRDELEKISEVDLASSAAQPALIPECALVGPIFVPFFIVPKLDWLFWSWFKAFIQYSFIPVVAFAFLMIFERFVFQYLTTLPPGITEDLYLVYGIQALVVIGTFVAGILLIPSLTSSIFSGRGGESVLPAQFFRI
jgi:hypothetical protein